MKNFSSNIWNSMNINGFKNKVFRKFIRLLENDTMSAIIQKVLI